MSDITTLAEQLAAERKSQGLTQSALAQKLGMKQSQISDIEAGKRNIRMGTLIEVARGVGLELVMVKRSLLPAVSYVTRSVQPSGKVYEQRSKYEILGEE